MLSPLSAAFDGSSAAGGSDAITFMSGSGSAPGITISGSSPGCQRSIFSTGPPSEVLPKNRLAVFTEKPSCDGAGSSGIAMASGAAFKSSSGWASSDIETSYWASGGALSASASSGSSDARSADGATAVVFAPATEALGDARLPGQQRCDILISNLVRDQCEDAETKTEGRETRVPRPVTQL